MEITLEETGGTLDYIFCSELKFADVDRLELNNSSSVCSRTTANKLFFETPVRSNDHPIEQKLWHHETSWLDMGKHEMSWYHITCTKKHGKLPMRYCIKCTYFEVNVRRSTWCWVTGLSWVLGKVYFNWVPWFFFGIYLLPIVFGDIDHLSLRISFLQIDDIRNWFFLVSYLSNSDSYLCVSRLLRCHFVWFFDFFIDLLPDV